MTAHSRVVIGDPAAETAGIQMLSLALNKGADWAGEHLPESPLKFTLPALLHTAAKTVALGSITGPETPVEILALAARNTFELYLRLKHLLLSDDNCQTWREEAATDQLQVYEGTLKLDVPEPDKSVLEAEVERVRKHAADRGLRPTGKIVAARHLAREAGLEPEYDAYFKVYSKFVHPSSFRVNWPVAASTPMYRATFIFKLQLYGHWMLDELETAVGLPCEQVLQDARRQYDAAITASALTLAALDRAPRH